MAKTIASMQAQLRGMVGDWKEDNSHPPNYIRENGMGEELARVDRWCGGYQDVYHPVMIGWRASHGNRHIDGIVMVVGDAGQSTENALNQAKAACSRALFHLRGED